jgi:hypothetical protein
VFLAKRLMDLVIMRSIFPASQSAIICLNCSRRWMFVAYTLIALTPTIPNLLFFGCTVCSMHLNSNSQPGFLTCADTAIGATLRFGVSASNPVSLELPQPWHLPYRRS